jgi:hypothetical protein
VDEVALKQVSGFSQFFSFPLLIIKTPLLQTHLSLSHEMCDSPDQVAYYHTFNPKLGASSVTWHMAGPQNKGSLVYGETGE